MLGGASGNLETVNKYSAHVGFVELIFSHRHQVGESGEGFGSDVIRGRLLPKLRVGSVHSAGYLPIVVSSRLRLGCKRRNKLLTLPAPGGPVTVYGNIGVAVLVVSVKRGISNADQLFIGGHNVSVVKSAAVCVFVGVVYVFTYNESVADSDISRI